MSNQSKIDPGRQHIDNLQRELRDKLEKGDPQAPKELVFAPSARPGYQGQRAHVTKLLDELRILFRLNRKSSGFAHERLRELRDAAAKAQNGLCYYCGCVMCKANLKADTSASAEHLIARQDGGQDTKTNVVAACRRCNTLRHGKYGGMDHARFKSLMAGGRAG